MKLPSNHFLQKLQKNTMELYIFMRSRGMFKSSKSFRYSIIIIRWTLYILNSFATIYEEYDFLFALILVHACLLIMRLYLAEYTLETRNSS